MQETVTGSLEFLSAISAASAFSAVVFKCRPSYGSCQTLPVEQQLPSLLNEIGVAAVATTS
jgi:hypothetical protein